MMLQRTVYKRLVVMLVVTLLLAGCSGAVIARPSLTVASGTERHVLQPAQPSTPVAAVAAYFRAINRHDYPAAFGVLNPNTYAWGYSGFLSRYRHTGSIDVNRLLDPGYRLHVYGAEFTCIAFAITEHRTAGSGQTGSIVRYGGNYFMERLPATGWRIDVFGSINRRGEGPHVRSRAACISRLPEPSPAGLDAVSFVDTKHGWAAGRTLTGAYVLRTVDGGKSWARTSVPVAVSQLDLVDSRHGWLLGENPPQCASSIELAPTLCHAVILTTDDGGSTWQIVRSGIRDEGFSSLQFVDRFHGWLAETQGSASCDICRSRVQRTSDGGRTWRTVFAITQLAPNVSFANVRDGWMGTGRPDTRGAIWVTHDGGATWRRQLHLPVQYMPEVDFLNARDGWALIGIAESWGMVNGCGYVLYRTADGGMTWHVAKQLSGMGVGGQPGGIRFITPSVGWIPTAQAGEKPTGGVRITVNGGRTWTDYQPQYDVPGLADIAPVSPRDGWFIGCERTDNGDRCSSLVHTTTGGHTWSRMSLTSLLASSS